MKPSRAIAFSIFLFILGYFTLDGIENLTGRLWFDSYIVRAYETSIDHYLILRVFVFLKALLICSFLTYTSLRLMTRRYWGPIILFCFLMLPLLYLIGFLKYRCDHVYDYLKGPDTIYEGKIFEYDPMLGKRAVKNTRAYQDFWIKTGNDFRKRVTIDSLGFRVAEQKYPITDSSLMLYLGCSFTWGDGCIAEETYPYLVSSRMQAPYINAGQSAYGLGQMALLADRLIPLYHPKYVFVQYSPWLIGRSLSPLKATVFYTDITFPYMVRQGDSLCLKGPIFQSGLFSFDSEKYRLSPASVTDKFHFYYDYGVNVLWHDLIRKYWFLVKNSLDKSSNPVSPEIAQPFLYQRIFAMAHRYNCKVYVVNIGGVYDTLPPPNGLFDGEQVINADSSLRAAAHWNAGDFQKLYYHWAMDGKDSVIADVHPNLYAHSIIADEILRCISDSK